MNDNNRRQSNPLKHLLAALLVMLAGALALSGCAQFSFPSLALDGTKADDAQNTDAATVAQQESVPETLPDPVPEPQETPKPGKLYEWTGDGRRLSRIVINTNEQKARFYDGKDQIGWTTIASGVSKHPTPRGEFTILEKVAKKRSNLYGKIVNSKGKVIKGSATDKDPIPPGGRFVGASMPHFMRMTYDGIGMHAGPIPRPGSPASHGCIRMPKTLAATVFKHVDNGTAVTVIGNGPDYGNYGERIARQKAEERARRAAAAAAAEGSALDALDAEVGVMRNAQANAGSSSGANFGSGSESSSGHNRTNPGRSDSGARRTSGNSTTTGTRSGTRSSVSSQAAAPRTQPTEPTANVDTPRAQAPDPTPPNAAGDADIDRPQSNTSPVETSSEAPGAPAASAPPMAPTSPEPAGVASPQAPAEPTTPVPATTGPAETGQQPQTSAQAPAPAAQPRVISEPNRPAETPNVPGPAPGSSSAAPSAPSNTPPSPPVRSASEPAPVLEPA